MRCTCLAVIVLNAFVLASAASAGQQVQGAGAGEVAMPRLIRFSGVLKDYTGRPHTGSVVVTFTLYPSQDGEEPLWCETQVVEVDEEGRFTAFLGASESAGLPLAIFRTGGEQWLGVQPQGAEEGPRILLIAVPYALKPADVDIVGGKPLSGGIAASLSSPQGAGYGINLVTGAIRTLASSGTTQANVAINGTGSPDRIPKFLDALGTIGDSGMIDVNGNIGVGTSNPTSKLTVAGDIESSTGFKIGGVTALSLVGTNTLVGSGAGQNNTGNELTAVGFGAGGANTALHNSFFGIYTGRANTTGPWNSFFGDGAGYSNISGEKNSFFGAGAGALNSTGSHNSFSGRDAGHYNTAGNDNSYFGQHAGYCNTGSSNSFYGFEAGAGILNHNVVPMTCSSNPASSGNSFFGNYAGYNHSAGSGNAIFGFNAGLSNTTENNNSFLGAFANGTAGITNATAIGYRAQVMQSNSLVLGSINGVNGAAADTNVGIGTTAPAARLHVQNGDIYVGSPGQGIILKSPDGTKCAKFSIDNSGAMVPTPQPCPSALQTEMLYTAQFGNGGGIISELILLNPSATATASGRAEFFDDGGHPLAFSLSGSPPATYKDFSLRPLGTITLSTDGSGNQIPASVRVSSSSAVAGFVRFNLPDLGVTGVGSGQPLSSFVMPVRGKKLAGIYSGIAIQNIESSPVDVSLSLRDSDGQQIANGITEVPNLAPFGHFAIYIYQLFPQAALDDYEGSLVVQVTGGKVAATALDLGLTLGQFTTLPVAAIR